MSFQETQRNIIRNIKTARNKKLWFEKNEPKNQDCIQFFEEENKNWKKILRIFINCKNNNLVIPKYFPSPIL